MSSRVNEVKIAEHFRATFSTPSGKVVLKHICNEICKMDQQLFAKDQLTQNANCVKHDVAIEIIETMKRR